jgi:hypothetical protein
LRRCLTLLLVAAALVVPNAASAHGRYGLARGYVSTVAGLVPNVLGVSVAVIGGDDRLRLSNYSGKTIVILGYQGEPYLRFAGRAVYENIRSPAVQLNRFRYPHGLAPGTTDVRAAPKWRKVARGLSFEWHEHRIHWTSRQAPAAVRDEPDTVHRIFYWRVPGRAAGRPFAITGFLGYVPPPASGGRGYGWVVPVAGAGLGAAALVALGLGARRRLRRAP